MSITNYTELQTAVANWLNRADLEQRIPEFIRLAEATLNKVVRTRQMVTQGAVSINPTVRYGSAPADMLEPIFLTSSRDDGALEQVSVQQLNWLRKRMSAAGTPRFYAIVGSRVEVAPANGAASALELDLAYYRQIPPLGPSTATNFLLTNDPDLYLYTTLLHASPFLKDDAKTQLFGTLVAQQVATAVQQQKVIQFDSKTPGPSLIAPSDVR